MSSSEKVVILGAGGHAREVLDLLEAVDADGRSLEVLGYLVDPEYLAAGAEVNGLPVLGGLDWLAAHAAEVRVACGIGYPHVRHRMVRRAEAHGARFLSLVHPRSSLTRWVELGTGVIVAAGCVVTNRVRLGDHVHLNVGSTISHDCVCEPFSGTAPGVHVAGGVVLGEGAYLGIGASVLPGVRVGRWSIAGAGAAVTRDIPANHVAVGVPAVARRERPAGWHLEAPA